MERRVALALLTLVVLTLACVDRSGTAGEVKRRMHLRINFVSFAQIQLSLPAKDEDEPRTG